MANHEQAGSFENLPGRPQPSPPPPPGAPAWSQPPTPAPGAYPPGQPAPYAAPVVWPEKSEALTALLLSIIGLAMCGGVFCPFGWWMANREMAGINAGLRDPDNRGMTTAAKVIGIIGTVILILSIVMFGVTVIFFFAAAR